MSGYRLLYTRLRTGQLLGELPAVSFGFVDEINAAGSFNATIALDDVASIEAPGAHPIPESSSTIDSPQAVTLETLIPAATGVYVERDGVILWGGVIWTAVLSLESATIEIGAEGFLSYLWRIGIRNDLSYNADQAVIAANLVNYAMGQPGASIGIAPASVAATTTRVRNYLAAERKPVGEALTQLAAVDGGFDFSFVHTLSGSMFSTLFVPTTNTIGRLTAHTFDLGTNMSALELSLDGAQVANLVEVFGQTIGETTTAGFAYDSASLATYPLLERSETAGDVKETPTLTAKAARSLRRRSVALRRARVEVFPDGEPSLGAYQVGDRVTLAGSYGALVVSGVWRITSLSVQVSGRDERVRMSLSPQEVF